MKYGLLFSMALFINSGFTQIVDSLVIKEVDSLVQVSQAHTGQRDYAKALEVNAVAENLALKKLGKESAGYGSCCFNRGRVNYFKGDHQEAERGYLEAKSIFEKVLGKEHPDYAGSLNNLGNLYKQMGNFEKAEPLYLEVKALRENMVGKDHPDYAQSLTNLAILYWNMGNYEKVESLFLQARDIWEKALGKEHPDYASSLNNLGIFYKGKANYEKAEPLYLEALAIRENVLGKEHPDYAASLNNLAVLYKEMGNYDKAEPLYLEALAIRADVHGKEHPSYATSLNNLAVLYGDMGNYEKVEPLYLEVKAIRESRFGKEHPDYAESLNNLAILYWNMGNYEKVEPLFLEARDIWGKVFGKEHPDYGVSLNNLAILYKDMGNYEKAEPLFIEARDLWAKVLGKEHPDYASSLNNLAILYQLLGHYTKAEPLFLEALTIREKVQGKDHPSYATCLNNLAVLYGDMGNYAKAEPLYEEAIAIRENALGITHPEFAQSLFGLANLYLDMGHYEKAEPLYQNAIAINEKVLGKEHPTYAETVNSLAQLYERQHRFAASDALLMEGSSLQQNILIKGTSFLSEQELAKYANTFQKSGDDLNSFLFARNDVSGQDGNLPGLAFNHALFHKGFLLTSVTRLHSQVNASPESEEIHLRLKSYRRRLSAEYIKPIAERKGISELEENANTVEKELARSVVGYAQAIQQVKWQDVQNALTENSIALEFVHFRVNFPHRTDRVQYAVLLVRPGEMAPQFIPLFEEKEFAHLLETDKERKADYVNELYAWTERGMIQLGGEKKSLHELIWQKIEATGLENISTIYYSPSGVLHRLNLGAIAINDESILSDRYNMVALNSTRQLINRQANKYTGKNRNALIFAGIEFDADTIHWNDPSFEPAIDDQTQDQWPADIAMNNTLRGGSWGSLKWTEKEGTAIAEVLHKALYHPLVMRGKGASEETFKLAPRGMGVSPRIIHIATHGFFFPDPVQALSSRSSLAKSEPVFKFSDNPMIRSGLIFAGGNYAWQNGKSFRPDMEDGILTAYEISQMNLSNTELVVLSACETGLGDIQGNEGVYGLQRAFKIAGAKYLIMSLWQVPDQETMVFMTTFYKNWLECEGGNKMTIQDAFRKTQREMKDRFINPYSWAAFVLVE